MSRVMLVPINSVRNNLPPVRSVDRMSESFLELRTSIRMHGMKRPILVRQIGRHKNSYTIIDGLRRYFAAIDNDLKTIPIVVAD